MLSTNQNAPFPTATLFEPAEFFDPRAVLIPVMTPRFFRPITLLLYPRTLNSANFNCQWSIPIFDKSSKLFGKSSEPHLHTSELIDTSSEVRSHHLADSRTFLTPRTFDPTRGFDPTRHSPVPRIWPFRGFDRTGHLPPPGLLTLLDF